IFKHYARLRYRLLPYIYSMAHVAARTGLPIMRAMPLAFPEDERRDELMQQYMFGEWFLTGAFVDTIHLPAGRWIDYWTGAAHDGPRDLPCPLPEGRGGPLFVRAGALVPTAPDMDYAGQRPLDDLGLEVYPWASSAFTLYEDDGETYRYLEGAVATTAMECRLERGELSLHLHPRQGAYEGMPATRRYAVRLHLESRPAAVELDGRPLPEGEGGWQWDEAARVAGLTAAEDLQRARPVVVSCR
ncbi:MAG: DUF5110 domain-containing protein, partial [Gemmatimonadota bacterium]